MQTHRQGIEVNSGEHKCLCFRYICKKKKKKLAGGVQVWDPLFLLLSHKKIWKITCYFSDPLLCFLQRRSLSSLTL